MRKALLLAVAILVGLSCVAYADTVRIVVEPLAITGGASAKTEQIQTEVGFRPTGNTFSVQVAGKTCTFGSSTHGSVPAGCNYSGIISGDSVTPKPREADATCMQIKPACK